MSEMDNNPYASPTANVARDSGAEAMGGLIENGRAVDAGRGTAWLAEGFEIFRKAPGMWIAITLIFFIGAMVVGVIPVLGGLAVNLLMPVFAAGLLLGCRKLEQGEPLEINQLFEGFKENVGQLILIGVIYMAGVIVIFGVVFVIGGASIFGAVMGGGRGLSVAAIGLFFIGMLIGLALLVPLAMAVWYAPALVVFHQQEAIAAMKQSFFGCLKNIVPFLIWGVIVFACSIIATIPAGLGFLVLWPVMIGSLYVSYKEIFCE
jgi:uncharacterized membrane protein